MPTTYSWSPVGERLLVPFEATQERRVNALGALYSHGPEAGRFEFETLASLPKSRSQNPRTTPEEIALRHGVDPHEVGCFDGERLVSFLWKLADRPADALADWKRELPLHIVLDNYSVHKGQVVKDALPALEAANIHLFYLPAYSPELSDIEPVWKDVEHHGIPIRSYALAGNLKRGVDTGLQEKAERLRAAYAERAAAGESRPGVSGEAARVVPTPTHIESAHSPMRPA